jgi:GNAT superfamily N-acetyltransferase
LLVKKEFTDLRFQTLRKGLLAHRIFFIDINISKMTVKGFYVSTDNAKLDMSIIYDFLNNRSYWATGRERKVFEKSMKHSLCFGVYDANNQQAGFARVITDFAVYAYILDLFILESYRGKGLSKLLLQSILEHEEMRTIKKWMLTTKDAHGLYKQFGFVQLSNQDQSMERLCD